MTKFDDTFSSHQTIIPTPSLKNVELKKWCVEQALKQSNYIEDDIVAMA